MKEEAKIRDEAGEESGIFRTMTTRAIHDSFPQLITMDRSPSNVPLPSSSSASLLCSAISQTASASGIDSPLSVSLQALPEG